MNMLDRKEIFAFLFVIFLTLVGIGMFFGLQGHVAIDTGREFYIPEQMLKGQVLYKDIFNIYGALAYQVNMFLYKIFGVNTLTLHIVGNIVGFNIIVLIYLLSRQFLDRFYSVFVAVMAIFVGILKMGIFNYTVPYSFAVIYGLLSALIALYLICFYYKKEDKKFLYFSVFFAGMAFAFKYDFAAFLLIYPIICCLQKESVKTFIKLVLVGLIVPIISFFAVFKSGVNFNDFLNSIELFRRIAQAPSLTFFYQNYGVYLTWKNLFSFPVMSYIGFISLILFTIKFKQIFNDKKYFILLLGVFFISIKSLFVCDIDMYGIYSFPLLLVSTIFLLNKYYLRNEKVLKIVLVLFLLSFIFKLISEDLKYRKIYQFKISTFKGWISAPSDKVSSKLLVDVILNKTQKTDKIVILPEGHMINFLTDRESDNFYGNLIPMYVEAFGEEEIINHYKNNKPEYFILTDRDTQEYGKQYICRDYAQNLCKWIFENYHVVYKINGEPQYLMLRINK